MRTELILLIAQLLKGAIAMARTWIRAVQFSVKVRKTSSILKN